MTYQQCAQALATSVRLQRDVKAYEMTTENASSGMLLYGVQAIADFLGIRKRQALGLIERGHLPHYHVGKIVCANRATVSAWLKSREAAAQAKPE